MKRKIVVSITPYSSVRLPIAGKSGSKSGTSSGKSASSGKSGGGGSSKSR